MRRIFIAAALLAVLPPAAPATAAASITKTEVRTASPKRTHKKLKDVVWEMFEQEDFRREGRPTQPLYMLEMRTKPFAGHVSDLCRVDGARFRFATRDGQPGNGDTPVRAIALDASHWFHFLTVPTPDRQKDIESAVPEDLTVKPAPVPAWDAACRALDSRKTHFFFAENEGDAFRGILAFQAFLAAVRTDPEFDVSCDIPREERESEATICRERILKYSQADLEGVESCEPGRGNWRCYLLYFPKRELRLEFREPARFGDDQWVIDEDELEWTILAGTPRELVE